MEFLQGSSVCSSVPSGCYGTPSAVQTELQLSQISSCPLLRLRGFAVCLQGPHTQPYGQSSFSNTLACPLYYQVTDKESEAHAFLMARLAREVTKVLAPFTHLSAFVRPSGLPGKQGGVPVSGLTLVEMCPSNSLLHSPPTHHVSSGQLPPNCVLVLSPNITPRQTSSAWVHLQH